MARRYRWLSPVDRERIAARVFEGVELKVVAGEFGASYTTVRRIRDEALLSRRRVGCSPYRLSFEERERILVGVARGESDAQIARAIGRHRSTVGREIARCGRRRGHYRALRAERDAQRRARRPKPSKLASSPRLLGEDERRLADGCSPE